MHKQRNPMENAPEVRASEARNAKTQIKGINAMTNHTLTAVNNQSSVFQFGDYAIRVINRGGEPWFVAADVCKALQLSNPTESLRSLEADEILTLSLTEGQKTGRGGAHSFNLVSESGMYTLVLRCRDAIKEGTVPNTFKNWVTKEVLPQIRKTGQYQPVPYAVNPMDALTKEQQDILRQLVTSHAAVLPKDKQAGAIIKTWSKLKAHFKVPYREIPQGEFSEALSIVQRTAAEWELVDDLPAQVEDLLAERKAQIREAAQMAISAAADMQMSFLDSILDGDCKLEKRFLVSSRTGQTQVQELDAGASVATPRQIASRLNDGGIYATDNELADIASACILNLKSRGEHRQWRADLASKRK